MEIDECLVPSVDPEVENQEEEMDIDSMLVEVRERVKSKPQSPDVEYLKPENNIKLKPDVSDLIQSFIKFTKVKRLFFNNGNMKKKLK